MTVWRLKGLKEDFTCRMFKFLDRNNDDDAQNAVNLNFNNITHQQGFVSVGIHIGNSLWRRKGRKFQKSKENVWKDLWLSSNICCRICCQPQALQCGHHKGKSCGTFCGFCLTTIGIWSFPKYYFPRLHKAHPMPFAWSETQALKLDWLSHSMLLPTQLANHLTKTSSLTKIHIWVFQVWAQ